MPWDSINFTTEPERYLRSVLSYCLEDAESQDFDFKASSRWFHAPFAERSRDLMDELDTADLVVMVATPGGHAQAASIIGEACSLRRVMTTEALVSRWHVVLAKRMPGSDFL